MIDSVSSLLSHPRLSCVCVPVDTVLVIAALLSQTRVSRFHHKEWMFPEKGDEKGEREREKLLLWMIRCKELHHLLLFLPASLSLSQLRAPDQANPFALLHHLAAPSLPPRHDANNAPLLCLPSYSMYDLITIIAATLTRIHPSFAFNSEGTREECIGKYCRRGRRGQWRKKKTFQLLRQRNREKETLHQGNEIVVQSMDLCDGTSERFIKQIVET